MHFNRISMLIWVIIPEQKSRLVIEIKLNINSDRFQFPRHSASAD